MKELKEFAKKMGACMLVEAEWEVQEFAGDESKMRDYMEDAANNYVANLTYSEASELELDGFVRGREITCGRGEYMDLDIALHQILTSWLYEIQPIIADCIVAYFNHDFAEAGKSGNNHECYYQMNKAIERLY